MKKTLYFLVFISMLFASCKKDEESKQYSVNGEVKNLADRAVRQGTVNLMTGNTISYTAAINSEGKYSVSDVKEGSYTLMIEAEGYITYTETVTISGDASLEAILTGETTMTGLIIDSQTGYGLAGAVVAFTWAVTKSGNGVASDTTLANADFVFTTDESGIIEMVGMPYGIFDVVVRANGFTTRLLYNINVTPGYFELPQITLVQQVLEGSVRIVLNWGENPWDLDSHLTGPMEDGTRFHMYYMNQEPAGSLVNLDVDDTDSYGPETTTLLTLRDGIYRFSIFNYSEQSIEGGSGIYTSPAIVEVYNSEGLVRSYTAPAFTAGSGNTWRVFELNVTGGNYTINDINYYLFAEDDYMEKHQPGSKKQAAKFHFGDF